MTTDSALRELVRRFRDNQRFHESEMFRSEDKVVIEARKASADAWQMAASRLESILTEAGEAQPAPAGMAQVPLPKVVPYGSESGEKDYAYGYEKGSADGWNACRAAIISATPPPTLNEAFDQVGAAMMREVCGHATTAAPVGMVKVPSEHAYDEDCNCEAVGYAKGWNAAITAAAAAKMAVSGEDPYEFGAGIKPNRAARYWQTRARFWRDQAISLGYKPVGELAAKFAQETRADGAIKCNACGGWNKPWQPGHIDCCDQYSASAAQVAP